MDTILTPVYSLSFLLWGLVLSMLEQGRKWLLGFSVSSLFSGFIIYVQTLSAFCANLHVGKTITLAPTSSAGKKVNER